VAQLYPIIAFCEGAWTKGRDVAQRLPAYGSDAWSLRLQAHDQAHLPAGAIPNKYKMAIVCNTVYPDLLPLSRKLKMWRGKLPFIEQINKS